MDPQELIQKGFPPSQILKTKINKFICIGEIIETSIIHIKTTILFNTKFSNEMQTKCVIGTLNFETAGVYIVLRELDRVEYTHFHNK